MVSKRLVLSGPPGITRLTQLLPLRGLYLPGVITSFGYIPDNVLINWGTLPLIAIPNRGRG